MAVAWGLRSLLPLASPGRSCIHSLRRAHRDRSGARFVPGFGAGNHRYGTTPGPLSGLRGILRVSEEVSEAVSTNRPVVALESTIYTHGALGNDLGLEAIVRQHGAVPAVCGILGGVPTVGLSPSEVARMVEEGAKKVSRRDLAHVVGMGLCGQKMHGGTTISGTMILARLAGIRVFGTGGLGGVHRGGQDSMDVSADLTELGRTRMAVVSSGCKGFLDIPRTLEFLETQGVLVSTFADGRTGPSVDFPAFWARDSGVASPSVVQDETQAAATVAAQERLGVESGLLFANPIPEEHAIPAPDMEAAISLAVREAAESGFAGHENTPYILKRIRELTQGRSVLANKHLVRANVARAAKIATQLSEMLSDATATCFFQAGPAHSESHTPLVEERIERTEEHGSIMVAGSVALDLSCDYTGHGSASSPELHTSNPATITQSVGGVGHNVALAAHRIGDAKVKLCSLVGQDVAADTILSTVRRSGLDTSCIRQPVPGARTAQYVAVNGADKNLVMGLADMDIFSDRCSPDEWASLMESARPSWLVVDGNWSAAGLRAWIRAGRAAGAHIAFEPVSVPKSTRLLAGSPDPLGVFPNHGVDLATPNELELAAMHAAARDAGLLDSTAWFEVVDAFGISSAGARDAFDRLAGRRATDAGVPARSVQLLPLVPTVVTKMGARGVLLTALLGPDDPRLRDPAEAPFVLSRAPAGHPHIGGVYMRHFSALDPGGPIVSVNGAGDTFVGALVAGLAAGGRVERLVDVAQRAAVMTLGSREAVSGDLGRLRGDLQREVEEHRK